MLKPEFLKELPEPSKSYWARAQEFLTKNNVEWESLEAFSPEYEEWVKYFKYLGFAPHMIKMAERRSIKIILVPAKHPQWFDQKFAGAKDAA